MTPSNPSTTHASIPEPTKATTTAITVWNPPLKDSMGFNGEVVAWSDSFELYNLGNGQRIFDPRMRMFYQMDSLSPFGAGGTNGYQYCQNNPIVYADPTGHLSWLSGVSIFMAIVSFVLAVVTFGASLIAGATLAAIVAGVGVALAGASAGLHIGGLVERAQGNVELANRLDWASLATGLGSALTGFGAIGLLGRAGASVSLLMRGTSSAVGRGANSAARALAEGMELGAVGRVSTAAYISRTSGAFPLLTATALGAVGSSSLGRLLGYAALGGGVSAALSMGAQYDIDQRRNPDRYAAANVPPSSPHINSREQP